MVDSMKSDAEPVEPRGILTSRTLAMPADANPSGDIFGGWIMSLMDVAAFLAATQKANGRVVTVSVSNINFLRPVSIGDAVCCYTEVKRVGRTSMTIQVQVWVLRQALGERVQVTEAEFTFVAIDDAKRPRPILGNTIPKAPPSSSIAS